MNKKFIILCCLMLGLVTLSRGEKKDILNDADVVEAQELVIHVEPELPNVVVTPTRQAPVMTASNLKPPLTDMVLGTSTPVKPSIQSSELLQVAGPKRIYEKDRQIGK